MYSIEYGLYGRLCLLCSCIRELVINAILVHNMIYNANFQVFICYHLATLYINIVDRQKNQRCLFDFVSFSLTCTIWPSVCHPTIECTKSLHRIKVKAFKIVTVLVKKRKVSTNLKSVNIDIIERIGHLLRSSSLERHYWGFDIDIRYFTTKRWKWHPFQWLLPPISTERFSHDDNNK